MYLSARLTSWNKRGGLKDDLPAGARRKNLLHITTPPLSLPPASTEAIAVRSAYLFTPNLPDE